MFERQWQPRWYAQRLTVLVDLPSFLLTAPPPSVSSADEGFTCTSCPPRHSLLGFELHSSLFFSSFWPQKWAFQPPDYYLLTETTANYSVWPDLPLDIHYNVLFVYWTSVLHWNENYEVAILYFHFCITPSSFLSGRPLMQFVDILLFHRLKCLNSNG